MPIPAYPALRIGKSLIKSAECCRTVTMMKSSLCSNWVLPLLLLCVCVVPSHVNVRVSATTPQPIIESAFSGKSGKTPKTKITKEYDSKVTKADAKATKNDRPIGKTVKVPKTPKVAKEPKAFKAPKVAKGESMPMENEPENSSQQNSIDDGTSSTLEATPKNDDTEDSIISSTDLTTTPTPTDDDKVSEEESMAVEDESDDSSRENSIEVSTSSTLAPTPVPVDSAGSELSTRMLLMAVLMMLAGPFIIL